jgi:glycosyltransferase involved in cell wall biosynthesis
VNVTYFSKYSDSGPSSRFRIFQFRELFETNGVQLSIQPLFDERYLELIRRKSLSTAIQKAGYVWSRFAEREKFLGSFSSDLTIIEHQLFPYLPFTLEEPFLPAGYVIEFDDAIYLTHPRKFPQLIQKAAAVIAGNRFLADYALQFQTQVHVIPTVLNTDVFQPAEKSGSSKIRLGWSGLEYNFKYLATLEPVIEKLQKNHSIEFVVLSGTPPKLSIPFRFEKWNKLAEVQQLNEFDIGIMPLEIDEWCRGKCGFKLLQYMALKIPSVATPVGVNSDIISEGENGFTATTTQEWEQKLSILIADAELRNKIGQSARQTVVGNYSTQVWFPKLVELYSTLAL